MNRFLLTLSIILSPVYSNFIDYGYQSEISPNYGRELPKITAVDVMVDITNDLSYKILRKHSIANRNNFAFSPTSLASVLIALYEGSQGAGATEIYNVLKLPWDRDLLRIGYRDIHRRLRKYFFNEENPLTGLSLSKDNVTITMQYEDILEFYGYSLEMDTHPFNDGGSQTTSASPTTESSTSTTESTTSSTQSSTTESTTSSTATPESTTSSIVTPESTTSSTVTPESTTSSSAEPESTTSSSAKPESTTSSLAPTTTTSSVMPDSSSSNPTTTPESTTSTVTSEPTTAKSSTVTPETTTQQTTMSPKSPTTEPNPETTTIFTESSTKEPQETSGSLPTTTEATPNESKTTPVESTEPTETSTMNTEDLTTDLSTTSSQDSTTMTTDSPTTLESTTRDATRILSTIDPSNVIFPPRRRKRPSSNHKIVRREGRFKRQFPIVFEDPTFTITVTPIQPQIPSFHFVPVDGNDDGINSFYQPKNAVINKKEIYHVFYLNAQETIQARYKVFNSILRFNYIQSIRSSVLELELDTPDYDLLIMIPDYEFGLDFLLEALKLAPSLRVIRQEMKPRWVQAIVPDFKLKGNIFLTNDLQNMGILEVFEPSRADFSPMTNESDIYVKHIEQSINVHLRTRPADQLKRHIGPFNRPIEVSVNHPFLFFIVDKEIDVAIMAGRVLNPVNVRIH